MVQSRAVASRLKHVFDMLLEIETILFSGDLSYETFLFPFLLQKFFASYTRQLATFVGRFSRATKVAPCMVALKEQDGMTLAKVKEQDGMTLAKVKTRPSEPRPALH